MRQFKPEATDFGLRADVYLANQYPEFSRSSLEKLFEGRVSAGGQPIKPSFKVSEATKLSVDDSLLYKKPPRINLPIIYEDKDVIVIDKPAGVLTHSKGALNTEATVASFIAPKLAKELSGNRAGIVHRLDRQTSGVIITAKNPAALSWLQKQFSTRKTKKNYLAVAEGQLDPPQAIIDAPIARNPKKPQTFYVNSAGKPAQTQYKLIKILNELSISNGASKSSNFFSLVELKPLTGRTHQLRVHLAYINHPVVGDRVYGHEAKHMLLHAQSLELTLPNRERRVFEAKTPKYFEEFIV
ncbi:RluA family pseudouridine synthase [Candidatus Saccharibacteria bacterium]|nr:RluA family pseudouridine synthase [Candidatus Saccharibacteria bacterium]